MSLPCCLVITLFTRKDGYQVADLVSLFLLSRLSISQSNPEFLKMTEYVYLICQRMKQRMWDKKSAEYSKDTVLVVKLKLTRKLHITLMSPLISQKGSIAHIESQIIFPSTSMHRAITLRLSRNLSQLKSTDGWTSWIVMKQRLIFRPRCTRMR